MTEIPAEQIEIFEQSKQSSVAQLLIKAARLCNETALRRIQQRFPAIRPAHTGVLPHIDWQGTRITELAVRMKVSKQAVSQLVQDMVTLGLLELRPDIADGRAKRVYFSQAGFEAMQEGLNTLGQIQTDVSAVMGTESIEQLLSLLQLLVPVLERYSES